nr:MAG TPA: hypothetical protein [Caudoviricetes sp.]
MIKMGRVLAMLLHSRQQIEGFGHIPRFKGAGQILFQKFFPGLKLCKRKSVTQAIMVNNRLPTNSAGGVFICHLNFKIRHDTCFLISVSDLAKNRLIVMSGAAPSAFSSRSLVAHSHLAQNRNFCHIHFPLTFKLSQAHEIVTIIVNRYKTLGQATINSIFSIHHCVHMDLHPFLTEHRRSYKVGP